MSDPVAVLIDLINRHDEFRVFARPIVVDKLVDLAKLDATDAGRVADAILDALESAADVDPA